MVTTYPVSSYASTKAVLVNGTTVSVTVTAPALSGGTTGSWVVQAVPLSFAPIMNSTGLAPGFLGSSAVSGIESTYGNKEVPLRTSDQFSNSQSSNPGPASPGEYAIDYGNGILYIVPLIAGTFYVSYYVRATVTTTL